MFLGNSGQAFDLTLVGKCDGVSSIVYSGPEATSPGEYRLALYELKKLLPELTVLTTTTVKASTPDLFIIVVGLTCNA